MSTKTKAQKSARALQKRTGWTYTECLRLVTTVTPDGIEALILIRTEAAP